MPNSSLFDFKSLTGGSGAPRSGPRIREVSARDRERFFFLMSMMLKCGQTTEQALRAVAKAFRAEKKEDLSAGLHAIAQKVSQGRPLNKAMELEYVMFSEIHRAAILAGEASNNMQQAFAILQFLEDKKIKQARGGMSELLTPAALAALSSVSFFNTGLNTMPTMVKLKEAQGKQIGGLPRFVMDFTSTCADNWYFILAFVIILAIVLFSMVRSPQGRYWIDYYTLEVPWYGKYIAFGTYANMLLYFPHLIASGVSAKQMIPIMEALSTNTILRRRIDLFNQVITTGGQMSEAMDKAGFPSIVVTPVQVSENYAGATDGVNNVMIEGMNHAYDIINRQLEDTHKTFISVGSAILWILGGGIMMMEMMSIILAQA